MTSLNWQKIGDYRKDIMIKQWIIHLFIICVVLCTAINTSAETLDKAIGEVPVLLLTHSASYTTGPERIYDVAIGWNRVFVRNDILSSVTISGTKYAIASEVGIDFVETDIFTEGTTYTKKQSLGVWMVHFQDNETSGMNITALENYLTSKSLELFNDLSNITFDFEQDVGDVYVFNIVVESGHEKNDWRDKIIATIEGSTISFSFLKYQGRGTAMVLSKSIIFNDNWFAVAESGSKLLQ
ncbi:hypothetical protein JW998_09030 [candidate division KSB1 bacterium]|nr:hypothetical protein [candidate division KSB1 bacterium]